MVWPWGKERQEPRGGEAVSAENARDESARPENAVPTASGEGGVSAVERGVSAVEGGVCAVERGVPAVGGDVLAADGGDAATAAGTEGGDLPEADAGMLTALIEVRAVREDLNRHLAEWNQELQSWGRWSREFRGWVEERFRNRDVRTPPNCARTHGDLRLETRLLREAVENARAEAAHLVDNLRGELPGLLAAAVAEREAESRREAGALRERVELLAEQVKELNTVVDVLRVQVLDSRKDLTKQDFLVHYKLADRMKAVFAERFVELTEARQAHEAGPQGRGRVAQQATLRREAELVRQMCRIFAEGGSAMERALEGVVTCDGAVALDDRQAALLSRVLKDAREIRDAITQTGHTYEFGFDLPDGTVADRQHHVPWTFCEYGQVVDFVATPAYLVAGKRLLLPHVFTVGGGA